MGEADPYTPGWYPDWGGALAVLVGAGPSVTAEQVEAFQGRAKVLTINRSHELAPWADVLYGCDFRFWEAYPQARAFAGLKVTQDKRASDKYPDLHRVRLVDGNTMQAIPGMVGSGGNGGFQLLNLTVQFGPRTIVLLGYDMHVAKGVHWHGRHAFKFAANPDDDLCLKWVESFAVASRFLKTMGVTVLNATPGSALDCFPKVDWRAL